MGLAGSLHCVGMCGPIAMALPYRGRSHLATLGNVLLYNTGRIATYSFLGLLLGMAGKGLLALGLQNFFSIAIGTLLLLAALFSFNLESRIARLPGLRQLTRWVRDQLSAVLGKGSPEGLFTVGVLNGLLPCGMVYMAVLGALNAGGLVEGIAFMALFGLGTVPLMALTALGGHLLSLRARSLIRRLTPVLLAVFGIMFIMRGFQIDLPDAFRTGWEAIPMCR